MSRAVLLLAEGFEEIETATLVDVLRRGGIEVTIAGLANSEGVRGSRGMVFVPDCELGEEEPDCDLLVLPGGTAGAEALADDVRVRTLVRDRVHQHRPVAAICAAPYVIDQAGVLPDHAFTCYPGWESRLSALGRRHEAVVDDGIVITSQGPATAMEFALALVDRLEGTAKAAEVARGLLFSH